jgi:TRAP-type C4-dicarboxylate transport system substrate-binding protein
MRAVSPAFVGCALLCAIAANAAGAEDARTVRAIGSWSMLSQFKDYEKPFWTVKVPELTHGEINVELEAFDDIGLKGGEVVRVMRLGLADFGTTILSYISDEHPRAEAVDLAGLTTSVTKAREVVESYKPVLNNDFLTKYGIRILAVYPYSAQMLMCKGPVQHLEELKNKKVRVSMQTLSDLLEAYGAVTVNTPFDQVHAQMKAGGIDCLVTGTLSAHSAKFYEVASHIYNLPLAWSNLVLSVNESAWKRLSPQNQQRLAGGIRDLENDLWRVAALQTELGLACNSGNSACTLPVKGAMTIIDPTPADQATLERLVRDFVVKRWVARCGAGCAEEWNATIGKVANIPVAP